MELFSDTNKNNLLLEFIKTSINDINKFLLENEQKHVNYEFIYYLSSFHTKADFIENIKNDFDEKIIDDVSYTISLYTKKINLYISLKNYEKARVFMEKPIIDENELKCLLKNIIKHDLIDFFEILDGYNIYFNDIIDSETLFLKSIKHNSVNCCKIFSKRIDIDNADLDESIDFCCKKEQIEILRIINEIEKINYYYFINSCAMGSLKSVQFFCENNEDMKYYYNTAIFEALKRKHFEIADYLLEKFDDKNYLLYRNMCEDYEDAYEFMQKKIDNRF